MSDQSSSSSILPLLTSLPLASPALPSLLSCHRPFQRPSLLSPSGASKFLSRISTTLLSRDAAIDEKHAALQIGAELVKQDTEGWVLAGWGKGWVGSVLAALSSQNLSLGSIPPYLELLQTLILAAPSAPSFEREAVHPIMGKLSTTMLKLVERTIQGAAADHEVAYHIFRSTRALLLHSPASFRPIVPSLRSLIIPLIIYASSDPVADEIRIAAVELLTSLYLTQGKAQISQSWRAEMGDAMIGMAVCLDAIVADGWQSDVKAPATLPPGLAPFPADATSRLPLALYALEGYTEIILALLSQSTSRPVLVPVTQITRLAIRILDLSLQSSTVPYISPQYHASLLASLPRIWTGGLLLAGIMCTSCGDHVLPQLSEILDTTLHLADTVPESFSETQIQLLRFHKLLLSVYPVATWPPDHPARLLKQCLSRLSPLLETGSSSTGTSISAGMANPVNGTSAAKKGKKRARGEEDGVLASLEGREGRRIGVEAETALEALQLVPHLHTAPLLSPPLLTLSIRLHLSLYLALPCLSSRRFADATIHTQLVEAVQHVLERACLMCEEGGHSKGWKGVIISVLGPTQGRLSPLLHPQLPPLTRPSPPLSALHFFTAETEDETKIRHELGIAHVTDAGERAHPEEDDEMQVDEPVETVIVPVAPNDVRAGKRDVLDTTLPPPIPGHVRILPTDRPQSGHYPAGSGAATRTPSRAAVSNKPESALDTVAEPQPTSSISIEPTSASDVSAVRKAAASSAVPTAVDSVTAMDHAKTISSDPAMFEQDFIGFSKGKGKEVDLSGELGLETGLTSPRGPAGVPGQSAGLGERSGNTEPKGEDGSDEGIPDLDSDFSGFDDEDDDEDGDEEEEGA